MYFGRVLLWALALLVLCAGALAAPGKFSAIKKGAKVAGKGLKILGAAGTAHDVYESIKHRRHG